MIQWDPVLIMCQIMAVQCFNYLALGTLLSLAHIVLDTPVSIDHFFAPHYTHMTSLNGGTDCLCMLLTSIVGAYILSIVVEKSKKCVDFTVTMYLIHLAICTYYNVGTALLNGVYSSRI